MYACLSVCLRVEADRAVLALTEGLGHAQVRTCDMGGQATTTDFTLAVIAEIL
jgi:isocitrate/isopropylmalate dehydrogenase